MSEAREIGYDYAGPQGNRLKIEVGQTAQLRFVGKPIAFEDVFTDRDTQEQTKRERYASTVILRTPQGDKVLGFQYSWQVLKQLKALSQKASWGDPSGYDVEIENTGKLPDYWKVTPVEKKPLSEQENQAVSDAAIDLDALYVKKDKRDDEYDPFQKD